MRRASPRGVNSAALDPNAPRETPLSERPFRVIQWATGGVGKAAIEGILRHPELELAGCWVHSAEKDGKDVGEILGGAPVGVRATSRIDDILGLDADAVVYAPIIPNADEV